MSWAFDQPLLVTPCFDWYYSQLIPLIPISYCRLNSSNFRFMSETAPDVLVCLWLWVLRVFCEYWNFPRIVKLPLCRFEYIYSDYIWIYKETNTAIQISLTIEQVFFILLLCAADFYKDYKYAKRSMCDCRESFLGTPRQWNGMGSLLFAVFGLALALQSSFLRKPMW